MSFPRIGLRTGLLAGRLTVLSLDGQSAAYAGGLKVADRILSVGAARPRDELHFRRILRVVQGDPIDFVVERRLPVTVSTF